MADRRPRGSSSERRSWRHAGSTRGRQPPSMRSLRWFFTILALALLGVLAYLLWPRPGGVRRLVALPIWATDQLVVASQPYVREDIDALDELAHSLAEHDDVQFHWSLGMQDARSFANLDADLREITSADDDLLMLYLSAQGVSGRTESGDWSAYLVFSDYMRMGQGGRCPISELLHDVRSAKSKMKLLVLDSARIAYDPRLGVAANEFPRLVEKELAKLDEEELWVLLPAGPLQRAAVAHPLKHSVFGSSIAEALQGKADQWPQDRFVSLYELYRYVFEKCANWYDPDTGAAQTPLLMKAGKGIVEPEQAAEGDDAHRLLWVKRKPTTKEPEAEEKPVEPENEKPTKAAAEDQSSFLPDWVLNTRYGALQTGAEAPAKAKASASPDARGKPKPVDRQSAAPEVPPSSDAGPKKPAPTPAAKEKKRTDAPVAKRMENKKPDSVGAKKRFNEWVAQLRLHVHEAWTLRDALAEPQAAEARSPAEFAPHLWRQLNARVLYYEQRCRSGRPVQAEPSSGQSPGQDMAQLVASAGALVGDLGRLQTLLAGRVQPSSQEFRHAVCDRLAEAWRRYAQQDQAVREGGLSELRQLRDATRRYHRLLFVAPYYVRWHAEASITSAHRAPLYAEIERFLDGLLRFQEMLAALERGPIKADEIGKLLDALEESRSLQSLSGNIDQLLRVRETTAIDNIGRPIHQQEAEDLLSTPLLSAPRRKRLLEALLGAAAKADRGQTRQVAFPRSVTATPERWQRLLDRLRLEQKLIRLANPDAADSLGEPIAEIERLLPQLPGSEGRLWLTCRRLGSRLRDIYAGLPDGADYPSLHLIDPRDTAKDAFGIARSYPFPEFGVTVERPVLLRLAGPAQERLEKGKPRPITLIVTASKRELLMPRSTPRLQYDAKHIDVSGPEAGPIERADGWFRKKFTWQVDARVDQREANASETDLTVIVPWTDGREDKQASHTVNLTLPQPNRIDLEVIRIGASEHRPDSAATVVLELYPNRRTRYQFTLVNRSGAAKQVEVALYAIPPESSPTAAPGRIGRRLREIVLDEVTGILDAELIAKTRGPIQLPADAAQREPVSFARPGSAAKEKPAEETGSKPENKPKPPPAPEMHDVSSGLVCVITDTADTNARWIKWIELEPLAPHNYLAATIGYDYDREQIVANLRPRDFDDDGKPDLPPGAPVDIAWNDDYGQIPDEAKKRLGGQIDTVDARLELYAAVPPDNITRTVSLTVDRYPRAFVYQVKCDRQRPLSPFRSGSDVRRTARRIRINSISAAGYPVVFHFSPYAAYPAPEELEKDKRKHLKIAPDEPIVVPAPCSSLRVDFEADAPVDAFRDPDDKIEVALGEDLTKPARVFDDRSMTTHLVAFGDRGLVEFETEVGDYSVKLLPGDLENEKTYIEAKLLLPGIGQAGDHQASDHVVLLLDSDKPAIQELQLMTPDRRSPVPVVDQASQVVKGATLLASVQARDLSGLAEAEYGFAKPGKREMDPKSATKITLTDVRSTDLTHVFDLRLETKDLEVGEHVLMVRLSDKVGHQSEILAQNIRIVAAQPEPQKGAIAGAIRFGPNRVPVNGLLFTATIKGPKIGVKPIAVKADGTFFIKDLPPGPYTISAQGSFQGRTAEGTAEGVQPSPPDSVDRISVIVDRKKP